MSIAQHYIDLANEIHQQISLPALSQVYLPAHDNSAEYRDEFGLFFLADGTAAPFYTSLPGTLSKLQDLFPQTPDIEQNTLTLIRLFTDDEPAHKAIALGAFNTMSQYLMKRAGLLPQQAQATGKNMGTGKPQKGEQIGMIGYFCPLIDKLLAQGVEVLVIERQPQRVELRPGLSLSQNPADLSSCRVVLCTAATLINDSLDEVLSHCADAENFSIIGPSGSGLPDVLFDRGVHSVGGVFFADSQRLRRKLEAQTGWGDAGEKYQLRPEHYPGFQSLLNSVS